MLQKLSNLICLVFSLWLVTAAAGQAQGIAPPPLTGGDLDPAPWRATANAWAAAAPGEEPAFLEMRVAQDTFIVSQYPLDWHVFGSEKSVWFGNDADAGMIHALLRWNLEKIPGRYLGAVVYLPIAGQDAEVDMPASAYVIQRDWNEADIKWADWVGIHAVSGAPLAEFTIGKELRWYWFEASTLVQSWYDYGNNYGIQVRGSNSSLKVTKGMFSHEAGDDKSVAMLVIAYRPDRVPPTCSLNALPFVSPAPIRLAYSCADDNTGVASAELQMRRQGGDWQTIPHFSYSEYQMWTDVSDVLGGNTYSFRLRATDRAGNVSEWTPDGAAVTTIEDTPPVIKVTGRLQWFKAERGESAISSLHSAEDPGPIVSGISEMRLQYQDLADGVWHDVVPSRTTYTPGHQYRFRVQAVDWAKNASAWVAFGPATAYLRAFGGQILDSRGNILAGVIVEALPAGLNRSVTDETGRFILYLADTDAQRMSVVSAGLTLTEDDVIPVAVNDEIISSPYRVRRLADTIVNGDFDAPLSNQWQGNGTRIARDQRSILNPNRTLRYGAPAPVVMDTSPMMVPTIAPVCITAGPDGTLHLAWGDGMYPSMRNTLYYAARLPDSDTWSTPVVLAEKSIFPPSCEIRAASDGGVGLAYQKEESEGHYFRFKPPAGNWGTEEWAELNGLAQLAVGPGGRAELLAYNPTLLYTRRESSGQWTPPTPLLLGTASQMWVLDTMLHVSRDGVRHYTWIQNDGGAINLMYSASADGVSWSLPQPLAGNIGTAMVRMAEAPDGRIAVVWANVEGEHVRFFHTLGRGDNWSGAAALNMLVQGTSLSNFAIRADAQGTWHLWYAPRDFSSDSEGLFTGSTLQTLALRYLLQRSGDHGKDALISTPTALYLFRSFSVFWKVMDVSLPSLVELPAQLSVEPASVSQSVVVPDQAAYPTLSWLGLPGRLDVAAEGGRLVVELTDRTGATHELAVMTEADAGHAWANLTPWAGQPVTLTFRFDPRGDPTAWAWLDDVHLGGLPLNVGVGLTDAQRPAAGQPYTFTLTVSNQRPYSLTVPVDLTWPAAWPLTASITPTHSAAGTARFDVPLDGLAQVSITCVVEIPAGDKPAAATISAAIGQAVANQDYAPADNRAELTVIVNGRPTWLPVIMR